MQACIELGLGVRHCPAEDKFRPGEINEAHCEIVPPAGLSQNQVRSKRDDLLKKSTVIRVGPNTTANLSDVPPLEP